MSTDDPRSIFRLAADRPVGVCMCVIAIVVFGALSIRKLPIDLMPEINYPTVTVRTELPGAAPLEVEDRVTRPIEGGLAVLNNLVTVRSTSRAGASDVVLEFDWNTPMKAISQDIREKLDRTNLPRELEPPRILRYDPSQEPVMRIGLTSDRLPLVELRDIADREIEWRLEQVDGVADVRIRGGLEKEIQIQADPDLLRRYNLTAETVQARLAQENVNLASGLLREGDTEYLVRTLNEFRTVDEIRSLTLTYDNGVPVRLSDIARVLVTHKERDIITRLNGRESVELMVFKEAGANTVRVAEDIRTRLFGSDAQRAALAERDARRTRDAERLAKAEREGTKAEGSGRGGRRGGGGRHGGGGRGGDVDFVARFLPPGTDAIVLSDQSTFIAASIREVVWSAIYGGVLAALMLFLFLGRLKPTLIVVTAIPISAMVTFAPLYLGGITLNIMSLGGLAMGIGMLVDNSIVVTESIFRCRQEGDGVRDAAIRGTREVGGAVTASTLTSIAVFLPIVFVQGVAGQIFRDHALTVVFSLVASLVVSLILVPMLAARGAGWVRPEGAASRPVAALWSWPFAFRNIAASWRTFRTARIRGALALLVNLVTAPVQLALEVVGRVVVATGVVVAAVALVIGRAVAFVVGPAVRFALVKPFNAAYAVLAALYPPVVRAALQMRLAVVVVCLALVAWSAWLVRDVGIDLVPEAHQGEFTIRLGLALGTPVQRTDAVVTPLADAIGGLDAVRNVVVASGVARDEVAESDEGEHSARILVQLADGYRSPEAEAETKRRIRRIARDDPDVAGTPQFENPSLFATRTPIEVVIKSKNPETLRRVADRVEAMLNEPEFANVDDVRSNLRAGNPEVLIRFDRRKLVDLGLELEVVAKRVRTALQGEVATRFNDRDRKVDLLVRLDERIQTSLDELRRLVINPDEPFPRPLEDVATVTRDTGPAEIFRIDQQRAALVRANLTGVDLGHTGALIEARLREIEASEADAVTSLGGQSAEMKTATASMTTALLLALFLVYVVMASQFESLLHPFVILLTFPLATVGVIPVLYALDIRLSVVVGIGAIMLSGIVVNDAIVLVDYVNQLRRRGMDRHEALVTAGVVRLRPIMMTTATTILGLLPLTGALPFLPGFGDGEGMELRAPMAVTVIAGLVSATLLTLVVIPVVYDLFDFRRDSSATEAPAADALDAGALEGGTA